MLSGQKTLPNEKLMNPRLNKKKDKNKKGHGCLDEMNLYFDMDKWTLAQNPQ